MLDVALWLFNRKGPYVALFFCALFGWFTFTGVQDLRERGLLDREGVVTRATVTKRYIKAATCPDQTGISALACNQDRPWADFTFEAQGVTVEASRATYAAYNFMETQDSFDVTYLPADPQHYRVETGAPQKSGWMHLPLGLAVGPILMVLMLGLFWRKGGFAKLRRRA